MIESSKSSGRPSSLQTLKTARRGTDLEGDMERRRHRRSMAAPVDEAAAADSRREI